LLLGTQELIGKKKKKACKLDVIVNGVMGYFLLLEPRLGLWPSVMHHGIEGNFKTNQSI
jgi:hypothetical protein